VVNMFCVKVRLADVIAVDVRKEKNKNENCSNL